MTRKGQVSPDYLVTITLLGIIALAVFTAFSDNEKRAFDTVEQIRARDLANYVAREVSSMAVMGDGSEKSITLAKTLGGVDYNITLKSDSLLLRWKDLDYGVRFPAVSMDRTVVLSPGQIAMQNIDGIISVANS